MEPAIFVMAILGCGEGDLPCREVRLADSRYENQSDCMAATEAELARQSDLLYPVVVAQCRPANGQAEPIRAAEVSLPEPETSRAFSRRESR